jgi:hypothetical protein
MRPADDADQGPMLIRPSSGTSAHPMTGLTVKFGS